MAINNKEQDFVQSMIVEAVEELAPAKGIVGVAPVSCGAFLYEGFDFDFCQSVPGCAPAVASGIKRVRPDALVFTYQNAVDLAAAGVSEAIHAANRGENISIIYANNGNDGLDGTADSRIRISELLAGLKRPVYIVRVLASEKNRNDAERAIKNAFKLQMEGKGFSLVEILCPEADEDSQEYKALLEELPVQVFRDTCGIEEA